jgi:hypothetical protein
MPIRTLKIPSFIFLFLLLMAAQASVSGNQLPQNRTFHMNKVFHYPGTQGIGTDVILLIQEFDFTVSSQSRAKINFNLTSEPSGLPLCFMIFPDPNQSGCPEGQQKVNGYCYPLSCDDIPGGTGQFNKKFESQLLEENGDSWRIGVHTRTRSDVPAGDYRITGTISVSFQLLLSKPTFVRPVIAAKITVTNPEELDIWRKGRRVSVAWEKTGVMNANVRIELLNQNRQPVRTLIANTPNDGKQRLRVPTNIPNGNYIIRVKTVDNAVKGDSGIFRIM